MKIIIYFSLVCFLFLSCTKEKNGFVVYKLKFTSASTQQGSPKSLTANIRPSKSVTSETFYTQFGDYITSITPYHYSANFSFLYSQSQKYVVNFVGNNWGGPNNPQELKIDFSDNQEVTVLPAIMSTDTAMNGETYWSAGSNYNENEVTFTYFSFIPYYFYQEMELPIEYENVELEQFNKTYQIPYWGIGQEKYYCDSVKSGHILKTKYFPLIQQIESRPDTRFNFGSRALASQPFMVGDTSTIIHGSFSPVTLTMPLEGETKVLYSTISFDIRNLIQLYAGTDNIPYSSDDIIVYAPEYWKRINVKMEIK